MGRCGMGDEKEGSLALGSQVLDLGSWARVIRPFDPAASVNSPNQHTSPGEESLWYKDVLGNYEIDVLFVARLNLCRSFPLICFGLVWPGLDLKC